MSDQTSTATSSSGAPPEPEHRASVAAQEARLEKVRKVYVRDLEQGERVHTVFLITRKARNVGRSGKAYLALALSDKTGEVDGRIFDHLDQLDPSFAVGDYVLVEGEVISFHGKAQVLVTTIERLDPEPIDRKEFVAQVAPQDTKRAAAQVRETVGRIRDPNLKALLQAFIEERQATDALDRPFGRPGAQGQRASLGDHLLSLAKLANRLADQYPMVDRDLLVSGALLCELASRTGSRGSDSVDEGRLVGRSVLAAQAIHEKAGQNPSFPAALEHHLVHMILACPERPEQGTHRAPMTLEALLLASIIHLDAEVSAWLELMARDPHEKWTEPSKAFNRPLWKGVIPTARNKAPVETKSRRPNGADRRRTSAAPTADQPPEPAIQEEPAENARLKEVVFKPLSELAPEAPPEQPEPSSQNS